MSILTRSELKALIEKENGPFVSIFMPTYRTGSEVQQGRIRLKNLLDQAEERLTLKGLRAPEVRKLLEPARDLEQDEFFWQHQKDGLAVFISPDLIKTYRLPIDFEETVVVSDNFHLKPLMPLLSGDGRFYILALSQDNIRLLEGTRDRIYEWELDHMPTSLAEALRFDEMEKQQQFHTQTQNPRGDRPAIFHGHGAGSDEDRTRILRYFQKVDQGVQDVLKDEQTPLVLAGVQYLFPIYREASDYRYLVDEGLEGNPEELKAETLHQQAWTLLQPYFEQARQDAVAQYNDLVHTTEQASSQLEEIVPAAYYGRIDKLFVARGLQRWGRFDPDTKTLHVHPEEQPNDEDLLDAVAAQTLVNGGAVYAVEPEEVPGDTSVAAIFRY